MEHQLDRFLDYEAREAEAQDNGYTCWAEYQADMNERKADMDYEADRMEELGL